MLKCALMTPLQQHEKHARRVRSFANHLTASEQQDFLPQGVGILHQQCAATQRVSFAKAAASGARFAQPAQQQFSRDERVYETAMLYGASHFKDADVPRPQKYSPAWSKAGTSSSKGAVHAAKGPVFEAVKGWTPQVHTISRSGGDIYIFLLPGVKAGDLRLQLSSSKLTISGKRVRGLKLTEGNAQGIEVPVRRSSDSWIALPALREQSRMARRPTTTEEGDFSVTCVFPPGGDLAAMRAQFDSGRLRVVLPKPSKAFTS